MRRLLSCLMLGIIAGFTMIAPVVRGDEVQAVQELTARGAKITAVKGVNAVLEVPDPTKWSDDDFKKISALPHLQRLGFGLGLTDHQLGLLSDPGEVTAISTNGANISDAGVKHFTTFKKLQTLAFFHPGKSFTGVGLADLASLPDLNNLTVAGSTTFGNEGLAAVTKLPHLMSFRIWHTSVDAEGLARLKDLTNLTSLTVGQRLSNKPPAAVSDAILPTLASMQSLQSLTLQEARLTLDSLRQLKALPRLQHLTLDSIDIPEADIATLKKDLPGVQIKWTPPTEQAMKRIKAMTP